MAKRTCSIFLFLAVSLTPLLLQDASADSFVRTPNLFKRKSIARWAKQVQEQFAPDLKVNLRTTEEWSEYVNHHHFVPLTCEGVPEDFLFDYNWDGTKENPSDHRKLPAAEVTETGEFFLWEDVCNYREYSKDACLQFITTAVRHEARHHTQWMGIALEASLKATSTRENPPSYPRTLSDLHRYPGAKELFMTKWGNCAHYQCREVEVYSTQILTGEMAPDLAQKRLKNLDIYYQGCKESEWAADFGGDLWRAENVFTSFGYQSQQVSEPTK
ncbi:MAG TPA: hypothetical protein VI895_09660 [Bdellovibrionota bacterium]|nr:hypothetical protein [Bdellovibrionota bacterium]